MIISKSNFLSNGVASITAGSALSGVVANVLDSNFAKNVSSTSSTFTISITNAGNSQYCALHGLNLPVGTVVNISGVGFSASHTTTKNVKNLVFINESIQISGSIVIQFVGSGTKTVSYIQAGQYSTISWGTNPGQSLYYLAITSKERVSINQRGLPVRRITEEQVPLLTLTMNNMLKSWARGDLEQIIQHYEQTGVLSIVDYEDENRADESVAGFELSNVNVRTHNTTKNLVNCSMTMRVSA